MAKEFEPLCVFNPGRKCIVRCPFYGYATKAIERLADRYRVDPDVLSNISFTRAEAIETADAVYDVPGVDIIASTCPLNKLEISA